MSAYPVGTPLAQHLPLALSQEDAESQAAIREAVAQGTEALEQLPRTTLARLFRAGASDAGVTQRQFCKQSNLDESAFSRFLNNIRGNPQSQRAVAVFLHPRLVAALGKGTERAPSTSSDARVSAAQPHEGKRVETGVAPRKDPLLDEGKPSPKRVAYIHEPSIDKGDQGDAVHPLVTTGYISVDVAREPKRVDYVQPPAEWTTRTAGPPGRPGDGPRRGDDDASGKHVDYIHAPAQERPRRSSDESSVPSESVSKATDDSLPRDKLMKPTREREREENLAIAPGSLEFDANGGLSLPGVAPTEWALRGDLIIRNTLRALTALGVGTVVLVDFDNTADEALDALADHVSTKASAAVVYFLHAGLWERYRRMIARCSPAVPVFPYVALTHFKNAADVAMTMEATMLAHVLPADVQFALVSRDNFAEELAARLRKASRVCQLVKDNDDIVHIRTSGGKKPKEV